MSSRLPILSFFLSNLLIAVTTTAHFAYTDVSITKKGGPNHQPRPSLFRQVLHILNTLSKILQRQAYCSAIQSLHPNAQELQGLNCQLLVETRFEIIRLYSKLDNKSLGSAFSFDSSMINGYIQSTPLR